MEKIYSYFTQYQSLIFFSLLYFTATAFIGLLLILRRASLFGMVLSQVAQVSFLVGMATAGYFKGHEHVYAMINRATSSGADWHFLEIDLFVFPVTILFLIPVVWSAIRGLSGKETILVIGLLFFLALYPLVNKISGGSDSVLAKAYFTEILYTPLGMFQHYLPYLLLLILAGLLLLKRILISGFDSVQATLSGLNAQFYNAILFFLAGLILSISVRVLGNYVSMAALIIPGFVALQTGRDLRRVFLLTIVLGAILPFTGFAVAFHFEQWPTEPILSLFMIVTGAGLIVVKKLIVKILKHNL